MGRRIVIATFGSLGDVHPYLAIARGLQARGHCPVIVTSNTHRDKIESAGVPFHPSPPDQCDFPETPAVIVGRANHQRTGAEFMLRELILPFLRRSYDALAVAARGADMILSHPLTYAAPLVAKKLDIPWAATVLAPRGLLSCYDPPVFGPAPWLRHLRALGPLPYRALFQVRDRRMRKWALPIGELRKELGLPESKVNPMIRGQFSPFLNLALFSAVFGLPQPDWPPHTVVTGFPFYDDEAEPALALELRKFLDSGPAPIVFTLASSAAMSARDFYQSSVDAAARLGRRALILVGTHPENRPVLPEKTRTIMLPYAPFAMVFPRAAAIVHSGGIGSTAQALRAGKPALIMPLAYDQPDNALRVERLGAGRTITRTRYNASTAERELRILLERPSYARKAERLSDAMAQENGVEVACHAIELACAAH